MALLMVPQQHYFRPVIRCDVCQEPLPQEGVVYWHPEVPDQLFFSHTGPCEAASRHPYSQPLFWLECPQIDATDLDV